ncbi:MAG: DinB family protein [Pedobacter sp.]|nr:DinB family protein [Chitinophagaceae bacterium]
MARPQVGDYSNFAKPYIDASTEETVASLITNHSKTLLDFINALPESKADFSYAEGKWTVKQALQHMIDTERIFTYRALTFARKDTIALPGFEQDDYAENAPAKHRSLANLKQEFSFLRQSTDLFLAALTDEELQQKGVANNHPLTVNAIAFIIFGHNLHHKKVFEEKYL